MPPIRTLRSDVALEEATGTDGVQIHGGRLHYFSLVGARLVGRVETG